MKWYFCFNEASTEWFEEMIEVAVVSALKNTNLEPHCVYDGGDTPLIGWLRAKNVRIHVSRVPLIRGFGRKMFSSET